MPLTKPYTSKEIEKIVQSTGVDVANTTFKQVKDAPVTHVVAFPTVAAVATVTKDFYLRNLLKYFMNCAQKNVSPAGEIGLGHMLADGVMNYAVTCKLKCQNQAQIKVRFDALMALIDNKKDFDSIFSDAQVKTSLSSLLAAYDLDDSQLLAADGINASGNNTVIIRTALNEALPAKPTAPSSGSAAGPADRTKIVLIPAPCDADKNNILVAQELVEFFNNGKHLIDVNAINDVQLANLRHAHQKLHDAKPANVTASNPKDPAAGGLLKAGNRALIKDYASADSLEVTEAANKTDLTIKSTDPRDKDLKPFIVEKDKMTFPLDGASDEQIKRLSKKFIIAFLAATFTGSSVEWKTVSAALMSDDLTALAPGLKAKLSYPYLSAPKENDNTKKAIAEMKNYLTTIDLKPPVPTAISASTITQEKNSSASKDSKDNKHTNPASTSQNSTKDADPEDNADDEDATVSNPTAPSSLT